MGEGERAGSPALFLEPQQFQASVSREESSRTSVGTPCCMMAARPDAHVTSCSNAAEPVAVS